MHFEFGFYSSLLLISFSQGIVFSALLLKKGLENGNRSNFWLSLFLLLCCMYIAPWMLGFAGWYDNQPYRDILFYIPFQQLFFIGPIIFFYTQSLLNPSFKFSRHELQHLIPGLLYLLYTIVLFVCDKVILHQYYFYKDGRDKDFDQWYQLAGLISMTAYFIFTIRYYNLYKKLIVQVTSFADTVLFRWIKNYLYAFLTMLLLQVLFYALMPFYPQLDSYVGGWWYYLFFSIVMYYIAITGYSNSVNAKIFFKTSVFDNEPMLLLSGKQTYLLEEAATIDVEYKSAETIISPEIEEWKNKILDLIQAEKLYENPELTLAEISKKLNTNATIVSKAINQGFQMNFNNYINNYRIEAVKEMFLKNEHKKQTLLSIAFDCGFNSKATFNRAFKKNTGFSPKDFLKHSK